MTPVEAHKHLVDAGYMPVWTIYEKPFDYPEGFIARANVASRDGQMQATTAVITGATLEEVRAQLPPGLACFPRDESDSYVIVESWL
jgi:hypothetical protein